MDEEKLLADITAILNQNLNTTITALNLAIMVINRERTQLKQLMETK
jgi:hypothetical protein